jgi:hypothetical protein
MKQLNKVKDLIDKGWMYLASVKLAEEIYNTSNLTDDASITEFFSDDDFMKIIQEANNNYNKVVNIFSYGTKWDEDELLLAYTHLVELILLDDLFEKNNFVLGLDMERLFEEISNIDLVQHKKQYDFVRKSFSKNWKEINAVEILENFLSKKNK